MALSDDRGQQRAVVIKKPIGLSANLDLSQSVALAKGILQNLGLKKRLGSLVVFVGHGSQSTNNPFQASLDCGACGGHSGESNARMAAQLLNNPEVRKALREEKIELPEECWFMAALHNTTTDEIVFFEEEGMPLFARDELEVLRTQLPAASKRAQEERNLRFGNPADESVYQRALDWSEVRPEWGLVNNSAFIAAPREFLTRVFIGEHSTGLKFVPNGGSLTTPRSSPLHVNLLKDFALMGEFSCIATIQRQMMTVRCSSLS
jgi:uncharacterized protein YbcC (UPF0753/DUF2309 family)